MNVHVPSPSGTTSLVVYLSVHLEMFSEMEVADLMFIDTVISSMYVSIILKYDCCSKLNKYLC